MQNCSPSHFVRVLIKSQTNVDYEEVTTQIYSFDSTHRASAYRKMISVLNAPSQTDLKTTFDSSGFEDLFLKARFPNIAYASTGKAIVNQEESSSEDLEAFEDAIVSYEKARLKHPEECKDVKDVVKDLESFLSLLYYHMREYPQDFVWVNRRLEESLERLRHDPSGQSDDLVRTRSGDADGVSIPTTFDSDA